MTAKNQARETAKRVYAEQRWGDYDEDEGLSEANLCLAAVKAGMADRLVVEDARPPEPEWTTVPARDGIEAQHGLNDIYPSDPVRVPTSREVIIACGGDPDAPFEVGPFPPEMRERPPEPLVERCTACGTYAPKAFASECGRPDCKYRVAEPVDDGLEECLKAVRRRAGDYNGEDRWATEWGDLFRTELASRGLAVRPVVEMSEDELNNAHKLHWKTTSFANPRISNQAAFRAGFLLGGGKLIGEAG